jgi:NAD-dependent deacetylase
MEGLEQLVQLINDSSNIVFFGGAGVSTASDIPDFRSSNGIFSQRIKRNITPDQLVSHSFFMRYPDEFYDFYRKNLIYPNAKPNACHIGLSRLEEEGKLKAIITQNIDGLHQMAGSRQVYELHGSIHRNYCVKCRTFYDASFIMESQGIPKCKKCDSIVKPDVVLYEEGLDDKILNDSIQAIKRADTLIIGGTALVVYPAAGLIHYFQGSNLILLNKSETSADQKANLVMHEDIAIIFQELMRLRVI